LKINIFYFNFVAIENNNNLKLKIMIRQINSLATAQAVINLLNCGDRITCLKKDWWIEAYQNGREQGFMITDISKVAYYICKGRRTDAIYIYKGSYSMQSISEDAYENAHCFERNFDQAVEWLTNELESFEK